MKVTKQYLSLCSFIVSVCFLFCFATQAGESSRSEHNQTENVQVLLADVQALSADRMEGRKSPSSGHKLAQEYLVSAFKKHNLLPFSSYPNFKQSFTVSSSDSEGANILAYFEGRTYPELFIVVTAHYDHLGSKGDRIFNGANDNASGVAALLALARYFNAHPPAYSLVFVATDAEEVGLLGAKHFTKHPAIELNKILVNVNIDMIGDGGNNNTLFYMGSKKLTAVHKMVGELKSELGHKKFRLKKLKSGRIGGSLIRKNWNYVSDHGAFKKVGIPYFYFGAMTNEQYHTVRDDFSNINQDFLFNAVSAIIKIVEQIQYLEPEQLVR